MERLVSADCPLLNLKNPINNRNLFSFGPTKKKGPRRDPVSFADRVRDYTARRFLPVTRSAPRASAPTPDSNSSFSSA